MTDLNFVIFYVDNPAASAGFDADLLGRKPVEASPTFAMFAMESGVMLGLWSRRTVEPAAVAAVGGMDFGHTFVALDPDGHRLRVFAPAAP